MLVDSRPALPGLFLTALLCACGGPERFDVPAGDATDDVRDVVTRVDVQDVVFQGRVCARDSDCDDAIPCTEDSCGPDMRCRNVPNAERCSDGVYCNGEEVCDTRRGCQRGEPVDCNDDFVCTEDRCVEATQSCEHAPLDRDGDGDPDVHCAARGCGDGGGTQPDGAACWVGRDCDDADPRVNSSSPEVCGDGVDNNCNGATDAAEPGGCVTPENDTCATALVLSESAQLALPMAGAAADYSLPCSPAVVHDKVIQLHFDAPHDLAVDAYTNGNVVELGLQSVCGSAVTADTLECDFGFMPQIRRHYLPAGDYYLIVGANGAGDVQLSVQITVATPPPVNETCSVAQAIPETGALITGDLANAVDDLSTPCGLNGRDLVYSLTLTAQHDVAVELATPRNTQASLSLLTDCGPPVVSQHCESGSMISFLAHQLAPGTYYLVVESLEPLPYTLDVQVLAPTPPPPGDVCADPLTLTTSGPTELHTGSMQDDYNETCFYGGHDAVLRFDLPRAQDVVVDVTSDYSNYLGVAIEDTCGDSASEHTCVAGAAPRAFGLGLAAGPHYVLLKPYRDDRLHVALHTFDPAVPVDVANNDTCATAYQVPAAGGYFRGDTSALMGDYASTCSGTLSTGSRGNDAVYKFHLDARTRVSLLNDGTFFNVLWVTAADACPGSDPGGTGFPCTYGVRTSLDLVLDPGDYYVFVDGVNDTDKGSYGLYVHFEPPPA